MRQRHLLKWTAGATCLGACAAAFALLGFPGRVREPGAWETLAVRVPAGDLACMEGQLGWLEADGVRDASVTIIFPGLSRAQFDLGGHRYVLCVALSPSGDWRIDSAVLESRIRCVTEEGVDLQ